MSAKGPAGASEEVWNSRPNQTDKAALSGHQIFGGGQHPHAVARGSKSRLDAQPVQPGRRQMGGAELHRPAGGKGVAEQLRAVFDDKPVVQFVKGVVGRGLEFSRRAFATMWRMEDGREEAADRRVVGG